MTSNKCRKCDRKVENFEPCRFRKDKKIGEIIWIEHINCDDKSVLEVGR